MQYLFVGFLNFKKIPLKYTVKSDKMNTGYIIPILNGLHITPGESGKDRAASPPRTPQTDFSADRRSLSPTERGKQAKKSYSDEGAV